jgi:large conductance mechanosensitive channel
VIAAYGKAGWVHFAFSIPVLIRLMTNHSGGFMLKEFIDFLKKYGVIGLAIAVVIGGKVNEFVTATVSDLLMPIIGLLLPGGAWATWVLEIGPIKLALGHWMGVAIDFLIVAFFVFLIAKIILREKEVAKK